MAGEAIVDIGVCNCEVLCQYHLNPDEDIQSDGVGEKSVEIPIWRRYVPLKLLNPTHFACRTITVIITSSFPICTARLALPISVCISYTRSHTSL